MNSNKPITNISSILTPESLSDIDTLTLQEKIQELQIHPQRVFYPQLLAMARLQLIERQKIQQFGIKLMNDEFQMVQIPEFPSTVETKLVKKEPIIFRSIKGNESNKAQRKKQMSEILKKTVVTSEMVFIGKPTLGNYRYMPKKNTVKQQKKSTIKSVKQTSVPKKKTIKPFIPQKEQTKKIILPVIKKTQPIYQQQTEKKKQLQSKEEVVRIKNTQTLMKEEAKSKPESKEKVQKIQIKYIENDVYDEMIAIQPQKLTDIVLSTEVQEEKNTSKIIPEDITFLDDSLSHHTEPIQEQICLQKSQILQQKSKTLDFLQVPSFDQKSKEIEIAEITPIVKQKKEKDYQENTQRFTKKQEIVPVNKYKSQSVKKIETVVKKEEKDVFEFISLKTQFKKEKTFQKTMTSFRPKIAYHQKIPTFNRLFPHSKNLIIDLRIIEQNLEDHHKKQVTKKSKNDEYLKLRESQLLFKVVSETEKAQKYSYLFDIELTSYVEKSKIMLSRLNKSFDPPLDDKTFLYRVVRQKEDVYDIVNNTFHRTSSWFELPHGLQLKTSSWNLLWTWSKPLVELSHLFYFQKINHFIGNKEIARKDLLKKNIEKIKKLGKKTKIAFDIIPETFFLPGENMQFVKKFRQCARQSNENYWILKPVGLSRGRGISLVSKIQDIVFSEPVILQKYLPNPLLLDGFKFDMRIYVLVTSIKPLEAFVYKEGFGRISTQKYSTDEQAITNKLIHLTNFSVQKENVQHAEDTFEKKVGGCKITLRVLKQKLSKMGIEWEGIESQIDSIVIKSLIACMNDIDPNPNCFELFGYDVIVDENLKCWLIQVNSSPSLEKQFLIDEIIKQQLVDDVIEVVNPVAYDRKRLLEVVSRRRKQLQGLKSHINTNNNSVHQLNADLEYILHGKELEERKESKNFRKVIPSQNYEKIMKIIKQYRSQD